MVKDSQDEKVTLAAFIDDNYKLLSALGIFTALTLFASNLPLRWIGYALSFLFLTATVLILLELWERFPSKSGTTRLFWFENALFLSGLVVVGYWFLEFRAIWHHLLFIPIASVLMWFFSAIIKRFNLFNVLFRTEPGGRRTLRHIFGLTLWGVVIVASLALASVLSPPINALLDEARQSMEPSEPYAPHPTPISVPTATPTRTPTPIPPTPTPTLPTPTPTLAAET